MQDYIPFGFVYENRQDQPVCQISQKVENQKPKNDMIFEKIIIEKKLESRNQAFLAGIIFFLHFIIHTA